MMRAVATFGIMLGVLVFGYLTLFLYWLWVSSGPPETEGRRTEYLLLSAAPAVLLVLGVALLRRLRAARRRSDSNGNER